MPVLLSLRDVSKSFDVQPLFEDLSLGIDQGARMGLIGPNGSGKSTLLRILAGVEKPDSGERAVPQGTRLVYLPQKDDFAKGATPVTVLTEAVRGSHPHWEDHQREVHVAAALTRLGFDSAGAPSSEQDVATLSGGWRKRLAISRALAQEPEVLLMDEPTNHLDVEGIWWLEGLLAEADFTYVVVSHDRFFLERVCGRVVELNRAYPGGWFGSVGGYSTFLEKRAEFMANQRRQQEVLDNKVRREIEWMRRNPAAQTVKSKARLGQAEDMIDDLATLKRRTGAADRRAGIDFTASGRRTNDLVVLEGVGKALGGKPLFAAVDLTLSPGTRLGLLGLNGSGKTTLLNVLARRLVPDTGTVRHASELRIEIFDQHRAAVDPRTTLRRALCPTGDTVVYRDRGLHIAAWAKRFLFDPRQLDVEVGKLSGGEQARILIADLMRRQADLLVLDEPTNDLDIPTLEVLEESLLDFPGAVVLVTHDRYLLDRVSTSLLALDGRGNAYPVADCSQWEALASRMRASSGAAVQAARGGGGGTGAANPRRSTPGLSSKERRELDALPDRITTAEQQVERLAARCGEPEVATNADKLDAACTELAAMQAEVERLYARWSELEAKAK